MRDRIRVAVLGLGHMGSGITKLLLEKEGFELVGVYDPWKAGGGHGIKDAAGGGYKAGGGHGSTGAGRGAYKPGGITSEGADIAEILELESPAGIKLSSELQPMLASAHPDIVLQATGSTMKHAAPEMEAALEAGAHIITICEEASYPWYGSPDIAERLDSLAKALGKTILGTGINPGFVLDFLVLALTGVCRRVEKIRATRINDLSPYGFNVLKTQGVNLSREAFDEGIKNGSVVGHFGFPESMNIIAAALGWEIDRIEEKRLPIISSVERDGGEAGHIKPGYTAGCNHTGIAYDRGGSPIIELYHPQQVHPELEGQETGDYIEIYGEPDIKLSSGPEIPGGIATTALAVNMIPKVLNAAPGFKTMVDLPPPSAIMTDVRKLLNSL